ncbi:MAG: VOC family protein [Hyphomicrobiaceae bacterium]
MKIKSLDHLVLTVASIEKTVAFYVDVFGMTHEPFGEGGNALKFGSQKINLHETGKEFEPKAMTPVPGSGDLCFLVENLATSVIELGAHDVEIIEGPVERTGACEKLMSVYLRDPDGNLIELAEAQS